MKGRSSDDDRGFGSRIRQAREARGWSQEELATRSAVSRPSIARIERGDDVSTATLGKVASALGLAVELTDPDEH